MKKNIACIILAAGKGERMKSILPKALHPLCGRPMLGYVLDLVRELKIKKSVCVLGYKHAEVKKFVPKGIKIAIQKRLVGTADAVKVGLSALKGLKGTILILYADIPLLKKESLEKLIKYHTQNYVDATILTAKTEKPAGYGRVLRDKYSTICGIVEEKDADALQKDIKEINTGIICFDGQKLSQELKHIRKNSRKKEYYLIDIISIFYKKGYLVDGVSIAEAGEAMGINSRLELAKANRIMQQRILEKIMQQGITVVDPATTFIAHGTQVGLDTVIYPFTVVQKDVKIGKRCFVGPFTHLREGTRLKDDCVAGNFVEIVRSQLDAKTWVRHFSYLGDSRIGKSVNIGAGTVTANFDGKKKSLTVIKDRAFIGSDTVLVAPVKIGKAAKTGAGAVVCKNNNVPDNAIVAGMPAKRLRLTKVK